LGLCRSLSSSVVLSWLVFNADEEDGGIISRKTPWRWCQSICFCASVAYSGTCQSIPIFFFFFFFVAPFSRWLKGLRRDLDRKMRKEELEDARV
jgi:Zn-dependent protease